MQSVPNHPYAMYSAGADPSGQWWIHLACKHCGDRTRKPCMQPKRTGQWVYKYATMHAHGLRPVHGR